MSAPIEIRIVVNWDINEIVALYRVAGWWREGYESSSIPLLIKGSFIFAVAIDLGKAVGMGRVISDGISDGYIQDVVVFREYRKKGVGKKIVLALLDECKKRGLGWIGLIAEPNSEQFYLPLGFRKLEDYVPLIYERSE